MYALMRVVLIFTTYIIINFMFASLKLLTNFENAH
jgi:hypothetical protein